LGKASVRDRLRADRATGFRSLADIDPAATPGASGKRSSLAKLPAVHERIYALQERLYAEGARSFLLVLQGMDTSGKDGTITHVIGGLHPQGTKITAFRAPSGEERRHDFLWRIERSLPIRGQVGIFNRSHYEDVLVVRVHRLVPRAVWFPRFAEINRFEAAAAARGMTILKVCLHISYDEQRRRLLARLDDPTKRWKFNAEDLQERARWSQYQRAYDEAIRRCSTPIAPWYVVPADHKWYRNWAVSHLLLETFEEMAPQYPVPILDLPALRAALEPPN
jgi:PPK2 family polyphosphate:nucleotide phosphotransferase